MFNRNEIPDTFGPPARIHYAWYEMEEYRPHGGMWITPPADERNSLIRAAESLMVDTPEFLAACLRATTEWPRSTGVAFTTPGLNRRAWVGHAACFLATGSPEETTRIAWHLLDDGEQYAANDAADTAISAWRDGLTDAQGELF
jgi:hypothetical protein